MKVVCISDTHCKLDKINLPEGDLLIHAGDLTFQGNVGEIVRELKILESQKHKWKKIIFIPGNHDWLAEYNPNFFKELCKEHGVTFLHDDWTEFEGKIIWGSGWTPFFCDWALNLPRGQALKEKWDLIPDTVDILVTHGPVYGLLDACPDGEHVGCQDLFNTVMQLQPDLHVCGHIHHSYGMANFNGTTFVNAAICTEMYLPINEPKIVELD